MSNSTDTVGCISHKGRFFVMYEDFREVARLASGREHEHKLAAFWRVLETKTNDRVTTIPEIAEECKQQGIPIPEEYLWVELSYTDCVRRSQEVYKSSAFQLAAAESERLGFSKSRVLKRPRNPSDSESSLEDYKEYIFFTGVMQTAINTGQLPTPIVFNSPLLKSFSARKAARKQKRAIENNSTPIENNSPGLLKTIPGAIENNRNKNKGNNTSKNDEEYESIGTSTIVPVPPLAPSLTQDDDTLTEDDIPTAEMPAVKKDITPQQPAQVSPPHAVADGSMSLPEQAAPGNSDTPSQCAFCTEEAQLTCLKCGRLVCYDEHGRYFPSSEEEWCVFCLDAHNVAIRLELARKKGESSDSTEDSHGVDRSNSGVSGKLHHRTVATQTGQTQAMVVSTPPGPSASQEKVTQANGKPTGKGNGKSKVEKPAPDLALDERCRGIQAKINELRGFALNKPGAIINERDVIRKHLAPDASFTDQQIGAIHHYIVNNYWEYKKLPDRRKVGAQVIWDEASNVQHILSTYEQDSETRDKAASNGRPQSKPIMNNGYDYGKILFQLAAVEGLQ